MQYFDTHAHIGLIFDDPIEQLLVCQQAKQAGVVGIVSICNSLMDFTQVYENLKTAEHVFHAVGVSPSEVQNPGKDWQRRIEESLKLPRVVAIGEIGLDYFRDLSPRPAQRTALAAQLELAARLDKPVVFHVRDAWPELMAFIDEVGLPPRGGVLHSFSGDAAVVEWALARGLKLGIGGVVTYKQSTLPAQVALAGPDHLLLETDAPWLPPVPHRGERNEPARLGLVLDKVAGILQMEPGEVERRTDASFAALFLERKAGLP